MNNVERYKIDPEFRERIKNHVRKYSKTKKGKAKQKRNMKKWKKRHPDYLKKYMAKKRKDARKKGFCIKCFKREALKDRSMCKICDSLNGIKKE